MHSISASKPYTGKLPYFCRQFPGPPLWPLKNFCIKKGRGPAPLGDADPLPCYFLCLQPCLLCCHQHSGAAGRKV